MTYDGFVLAAVAAELDRTISRGRIQKIRQHNDTDITLEIRAVGHTYVLFFSVSAKFSRVYLTATSNPVPKQAPNFCMLLRKHLGGAFITRVEQVGMDRILKIHAESPGHDNYVLVLEIMGKHSNLILLDETGRILGAAKHIGSSVSRHRQVLPGRDYIPPPGGDRLDPKSADQSLFDSLWGASFPERANPDEVRKWLMSTFSGFGPFLASELIKRAGEDSQVSGEALREELLQLGETVRRSTFMPVFVSGEKGEGVMVYPVPSVQFPPARQHERASINEALDALFRTLVSRSTLDDERKQTQTAIRRSTASRKQALKSIDRTLAESQKADRYREIGDILLADLHAVEKGARSIVLTDFFDPDTSQVEIRLDEKLTPQQNAERYFKRYRKTRDASTVAESRRKSVLREIDLLEAAGKEADSASSVGALRDLRRMLTQQELLRQEIIQEKQQQQFAGHRIRRLVTREGWEILYGENSQSNDYLTQRVARPNDVWLHARQITGAHVVIRTAGRKGGVPRPVMTQAALIAAQNSDAKHSSLVPVDHTLRKHVRKPRGSAPGFVTYRNEKTIDVNPNV